MRLPGGWTLLLCWLPKNWSSNLPSRNSHHKLYNLALFPALGFLPLRELSFTTYTEQWIGPVCGYISTFVASSKTNGKLALLHHWDNPLRIFFFLFITSCGISSTLLCSVNAGSWSNAQLFMTLVNMEPLLQNSLQDCGHCALLVIRWCPRDLWMKVSLSQMLCFRILIIKIHNWLPP